jgi:hypothetical protein
MAQYSISEYADVHLVYGECLNTTACQRQVGAQFVREFADRVVFQVPSGQCGSPSTRAPRRPPALEV